MATTSVSPRPAKRPFFARDDDEVTLDRNELPALPISVEEQDPQQGYQPWEVEDLEAEWLREPLRNEDDDVISKASKPEQDLQQGYQPRESEQLEGQRELPQDEDEDVILVSETGPPKPIRWKYKYLGGVCQNTSLFGLFKARCHNTLWSNTTDFMTEGWATVTSSKMLSLSVGDKVQLERWKPSKATAQSNAAKKKASGPASRAKESILVRFRNPKGFEVGRLSEQAATWVAKLLDYNLIRLDATVH